jgi:hypothetical protein
VRRHRELLALPDRPRARGAAANAVRIPAKRCAAVRRREPRHHRPASRHVPRRLFTQVDARRIRLPPSLLHRQPAAQVRGMARPSSSPRRRGPGR